MLGLVLPLALWTLYDVVRLFPAESVAFSVHRTFLEPVTFALIAVGVARALHVWPLAHAGGGGGGGPHPNKYAHHSRDSGRLAGAELAIILLLLVGNAVLAVVDVRPPPAAPPQVLAKPQLGNCTRLADANLPLLKSVCPASALPEIGVVDAASGFGPDEFEEAAAVVQKLRELAPSLQRFTGASAATVETCTDAGFIPTMCSRLFRTCDNECQPLKLCSDVCEHEVKSCLIFVYVAELAPPGSFMEGAVLAALPPPAPYTLDTMRVVEACETPQKRGSYTDGWGNVPLCSGPRGGARDMDSGGACHPGGYASRKAAYDASLAAVEAFKSDRRGAAGSEWELRQHLYRTAFALLVWLTPVLLSVAGASTRARATRVRVVATALPSSTAGAPPCTAAIAVASPAVTGGPRPLGPHTKTNSWMAPSPNAAAESKGVATHTPVTAVSGSPAADSPATVGTLETQDSAVNPLAPTTTIDAPAAPKALPTALSAVSLHVASQRTTESDGRSLLKHEAKSSSAPPSLVAPSFAHVLRWETAGIIVLLVANVAVMWRVVYDLEVAGHAGVASWFATVAIICLLASSRQVWAWDSLYAALVMQFRFGHRKYAVMSAADDRWCLSRTRFLLRKLDAWFEQNLGLMHGKHFELRLHVLEVMEVVVQITGLLQSVSVLPNAVFLTLMCAVGVSMFGAALLPLLPQGPAMRQAIMLFDLLCELFYLYFNAIVAFDVNDIVFAQVLALGMPVVLASVALIEITDAALFETVLEDCTTSGVPHSFVSLTSVRALELHVATSGAGMSSRHLDLHVDGATPKLLPRYVSEYTASAAEKAVVRARRAKWARRFVSGLVAATAIAVPAIAIVRVENQEAECVARVGALWDGVHPDEKRFFPNGFFAASDCRFDDVSALKLRESPIETIDERVRVFGRVMSVDARDNPALAHVTGHVGHLDKLEELLLDGSPAASHVDWSHSELQQWPRVLFGQSEAKVVNLGGNQLSSIPEDVTQLTSCESLNVSSNLISELPGHLTRMPSLKRLYAANNNLTELPVALVPFWAAAAELDISGNNITSIPPELTRLSQVDVRGNPVMTIDWESKSVLNLPAWLFGLPLTELNAIINFVSSIPPEIADARDTLRRVSLHDNQLDATGLPTSMRELRRLDYLDLGDNRLGFPTGSPPMQLFEMPAVRMLRLSCNSITSLPAAVWTMPSLEDLRLRANAKLTELPPVPLGAQPKLRMLDLRRTGLTDMPEMLLRPPLNNTIEVLFISNTPLQASMVANDILTWRLQNATGLQCVHSGRTTECYAPHLGPWIKDDAPINVWWQAHRDIFRQDWDSRPCLTEVSNRKTKV